MNRKLLVPTLAVAAAALLSGCVTGYQYRQGAGDYYYGQPAVEYDNGYYDGYGYGGYGGYGGGWGGSLGFGYGYGGGYPYWGYGYPFVYGYPYYEHHRHDHGHHHHNDGDDDDDDQDDHSGPPAQPIPPPRIGEIRPGHRPLLPGPMGRTPPLVRDPAVPMPRMSGPLPQHPWMSPPPAPHFDGTPRMAPPGRSDDAPRFHPAPRMNTERDGRRNSTR